MVSQVRRMSSPNSTGINASALKARSYGVSPIGCFGVMR